MLYIPRTKSNDYFQLVKAKFEEIDEDVLKSLPDESINRYNSVMEADNLAEFELKNEIKNLQSKNKGLNKKVNNLKKDNKKLNAQVKKLKKENKHLKNFKKSMINSKSWKLTKPLRSLKNKL